MCREIDVNNVTHGGQYNFPTRYIGLAEDMVVGVRSHNQIVPVFRVPSWLVEQYNNQPDKVYYQ